jgi:CheY-like chemotaxis protein
MGFQPVAAKPKDSYDSRRIDIQTLLEPPEGAFMNLQTEPNLKAISSHWRRDRATIVVVNEQPCLRQIAITILERCGYRVLTAANGEDAKSIMQVQANIDLVLTELEMPDISGENLASWLQANRPGVQIVFMSGAPCRPSAYYGRWMVEKPFIRIDLLIKAVREALDSSPEAAMMARQAA